MPVWLGGVDWSVGVSVGVGRLAACGQWAEREKMWCMCSVLRVDWETLFVGETGLLPKKNTKKIQKK